MASILICADTIRSPELRHEVPVEIMDPFLYAEVDGHRYAVVSHLEIQTVNNAAPDIEVIQPEQLGWDELVERHPDWEGAEQELIVRACRRMGIGEATVPSPSPRGAARPLDPPARARGPPARGGHRPRRGPPGFRAAPAREDRARARRDRAGA